MQVYPRIANPTMYNGTPDRTNTPAPIMVPGEIGCAFNDQNTGAGYVRMLLDSGATSSTPVGAVAAGQLAFFKDRARNIVTNDKRFAQAGPSGAINQIAGIFPCAVTAAPGVNGTDGNPLQYVCDLVIQKRGMLVSASTALIGAVATANTAANTANVVFNTGVTTAPPSQGVGVFTSSTITSNLATVDVNIAFVD